jgi:hypothetical protein
MARLTQADQVAETLRSMGGYATLRDLYESVPYGSWGTRTPHATIRRILQNDTKKRFSKIRPGLWALREFKEEVLRKLSIDSSASPDQIIQFEHSYYQGMVVEIGNLLGYETFVPKQDRNRKFLDKELSKIASAKQIYRFTYPHLLKIASTVDVVWFNSRKMPRAFWEIEHTTDFRISLLKFVEFQDFRINFYVVSEANRRKLFEEKIKQEAYKPIREWVRFVSYDDIAERYSAAKIYPKLKEL